MAKTLRSQNKCNDCRYTWYPRGKDLSRVCPNCGSANVAVVVNWMPLIAVGGVALYLVFGGKSSERASVSSSSPATEQTQVTVAEEMGTEPSLTGVNEKKASSDAVIVETESAPSTVRATIVPTAVPVTEPEQARHTPVASAPAPVITAAPIADKVDEFERVYTDEEISVLEEQKRYRGDDPIVRARLGIPSRETRKLIR